MHVTNRNHKLLRHCFALVDLQIYTFNDNLHKPHWNYACTNIKHLSQTKLQYNKTHCGNWVHIFSIHFSCKNIKQNIGLRCNILRKIILQLVSVICLLKWSFVATLNTENDQNIANNVFILLSTYKLRHEIPKYM